MLTMLSRLEVVNMFKPATLPNASIHHCNLHKRLPTVLLTLLLAIAVSGCTTRQLNDTMSGSTAQRLVTYSLEKFVSRLMKQPEIKSLAGKKIQLRVHFAQNHPMLQYARQLLDQQFQKRLKTTLTAEDGSAAFEVSIFFNSIGTDYDSYGLSVPTFGLATTPDARISILSVDMFHGITEGYALIKNTKSQDIVRSQRILSRVRADSVSTPIADFPINQLD